MIATMPWAVDDILSATGGEPVVEPRRRITLVGCRGVRDRSVPFDDRQVARELLKQQVAGGRR
jgi:hypothetical protein